MRAITIWQPWCSLIIIGAKPYEFRPKSFLDYSNHPKVGERVALHAGMRPVKQAEVVDLLQKCQEENGKHTGLIVDKAIPLLQRLMQASKCRGVIAEGAILGTAVFGEPRNAGTIFAGLPHDSDRGDFNFAWPMLEVRALPEPIHIRGAQGFWNCSIKEAA